MIIALVQDEDLPMLLVAPEEGWASINVKRMVIDSPNEDVLVGRFTKEFWRATAMVLGAANSIMQPCVLCQVNSLADLDACKALVPSPEPLPKLDQGAKSFGISFQRRMTYKKASCISVGA